MAFILTDYPYQNKHLQEVLRPLAESLRSVLYTGQANLDRHIEFITLLSQQNPDDIVDDGRANEGIKSVTVADMLIASNFLLNMLQWTQTTENLPMGQKAIDLCVRHLFIPSNQ